MDARIIEQPAYRLVGHAARVPLIHRGANPHIQRRIASLPLDEHERLKNLSSADPRGPQPSWSLVSYSPREKDFERQLARYGVVPESDTEPLTPRAAAHRYPGSVGVGERIASALPWIAVGLGCAVLIWGAVVVLGR